MFRSLFASRRPTQRRKSARRPSHALQFERLERREVYSVSPNAHAPEPNVAAEHAEGINKKLTEDTIKDYYRRYLGREAEAAGLEYHVNRMLKQGADFQQIKGGFLASPEYAKMHGGAGEDWVRGLYQDVLGRTPDAAGLQYYKDKLAHGESQSSVVSGILASPEHEVQDLYHNVLGRTPSESETQYWVDQIEHGATNKQIRDGFYESPEYKSKFPQATAQPEK